MERLYRIEELTTEGWTLIDNDAQQLTKELCDKKLDLYVNGGINPNRMRAVPDVGQENVYTTAQEQPGKKLQAPNIGSDKVDPTWQG
tara:strand:- start:297 stop:557 length:261 start_codon:yes stop_codon:yes gene_type:complete